MNSQPLLQGTSYARTFENGLLPQIRLSITTLHSMLTTRVLQRGAPKGTPSQIGKHLAPCYGFTENVHDQSLSGSHLSLTTPGLLAGAGKSILRCVTPHRVAS
jgi:hypothetical protein